MSEFSHSNNNSRRPARDCHSNALDPKIRRRENILGTIAIVAMILILFGIFYASYVPPGTPEAYQKRISKVDYVPGVAESIKESIRPVAADAIPEGHTLADDFVFTSVRTPDQYFMEYWMLIQDSAGNQDVIICDVPDNRDAFYYWAYVHRLIDYLPKVVLTTDDDGKNYHLSLSEEEARTMEVLITQIEMEP